MNFEYVLILTLSILVAVLVARGLQWPTNGPKRPDLKPGKQDDAEMSSMRLKLNELEKTVSMVDDTLMRHIKREVKRAADEKKEPENGNLFPADEMEELRARARARFPGRVL